MFRIGTLPAINVHLNEAAVELALALEDRRTKDTRSGACRRLFADLQPIFSGDECDARGLEDNAAGRQRLDWVTFAPCHCGEEREDDDYIGQR